MPEADPDRIVKCVKLGEELPGLAKPPFPTPLGQESFEKISSDAWEQWLQESVRYINTYRLDLSTPEGTQFMLKQMRIWLGFEEGDLAQTAWQAPEE